MIFALTTTELSFVSVQGPQFTAFQWHGVKQKTDASLGLSLLSRPPPGRVKVPSALKSSHATNACWPLCMCVVLHEGCSGSPKAQSGFWLKLQPEEHSAALISSGQI